MARTKEGYVTRVENTEDAIKQLSMHEAWLEDGADEFEDARVIAQLVRKGAL